MWQAPKDIADSTSPSQKARRGPTNKSLLRCEGGEIFCLDFDDFDVRLVTEKRKGLILTSSDCLRSEFQASGFAGREVAKVPISLRGRRVLIQTRTVHEPHRGSTCSTSVNVKTHIYFNGSHAFSCCFRTWF